MSFASGAARYDDGFCQMFVGDAIDVLSQLPEKSIHACVTSPPYFGLRSYLPSEHPDKAREGGTQETPEQYVAWLVDVFRGVWRVLRDDGTLWLNLGDSYAAGRTGGYSSASTLSGYTSENTKGRIHNGAATTRRAPHGYKPKDLLMIPARVALALQADGWYLRSQIVWTKPNPMPESVTDRPTQATEMVYLLSKKPRYFYDAEAVKESVQESSLARIRQSTFDQQKGGEKDYRNGTNPNRSMRQTLENFAANPSGRNLRNYWQISTRSYPGSHYATFPPELPLRAVKAGTSEHGVCSECGAPWRRVMETTKSWREGAETNPQSYVAGSGNPRIRPTNGGRNGGSGLTRSESRTTGFEPICLCRVMEGESRVLTIPDPIPATVLDPFSGSGTTGLIARKLGRRSILVDLDERNVRLLEQRMVQGVLL